MDSIENSLKEIEELGEVKSQFINCDEAKQFINSSPDPIDRELLWTAYSVVTFQMAPAEIAGQCDVLFFMRVIAQMFKDRDRLRRVLSGDLTDD